MWNAHKDSFSMRKTCARQLMTTVEFGKKMESALAATEDLSWKKINVLSILIDLSLKMTVFAKFSKTQYA